ncbi:MAG: Stf0 family sulfotransferase [Hyphomicrobiaceae bacterium]
MFAILFASRSGSTWLGQLLGSTGLVNDVREWMRPALLTRKAKQMGESDLAAVAAGMMADKAANGRFGFKGGIAALVPFILSCAFSSYRDNFRVVLLRREDVAMQAISLHKARLQRKFTLTAREKVRKKLEVDRSAYDFHQILGHVRTIGTVNDLLAEFAELNELPSLTIYYEDLVEDTPGVIGQVLGHLGLDSAAAVGLTASNVIQRDEVNEAWRARFLQDLARRPRDRELVERLSRRV